MTPVVERNEFPPNFDLISSNFDIGARKVVFAYGNVIYNPWRVTIWPFLVAHEAAHAKRQMQRIDGPRGWWEQYCLDPDFRLTEEFIGHGAELLQRLEGAANRRARRVIMAETIARIRSPLYKYRVSAEQVKQRFERYVELGYVD